MCRSIKRLFNVNHPVSEEDIRESAIQYVRKLSGMRKPSRKNEAAFNKAVEDMTALSALLLMTLHKL